MKRICIDASEVAQLIGRDITTAQSLLRTLKDVLKKEKRQSVTIKEFCEYQGLPFDEVFEMINNIKK